MAERFVNRRVQSVTEEETVGPGKETLQLRVP